MAIRADGVAMSTGDVGTEEIMKKIYEKYRHVLPVIVYFVVYMTWFNYIEKNRAAHYTVIHMNIDDKIPFCEVFIIPYLLWFVYVVAVVGYLMFTDKDDFYRNYTFLTIGMTVFLLVSTFWPNIQHLRPYVLLQTESFHQLHQFGKTYVLPVFEPFDGAQ